MHHGQAGLLFKPAESCALGLVDQADCWLSLTLCATKPEMISHVAPGVTDAVAYVKRKAKSPSDLNGSMLCAGSTILCKSGVL